MKPVMYIVLNKGLGMSTGKAAAQAAHAAVEAYLVTPESNLKRVWHRGGHYRKIVLEARDAEHLNTIERYIADRGFETALIIDEGATEIPSHSATALGVEIVDKDDAHVAATFSTFDFYTDEEEAKTPLPAPPDTLPCTQLPLPAPPDTLPWTQLPLPAPPAPPFPGPGRPIPLSPPVKPWVNPKPWQPSIAPPPLPKTWCYN